MPPAVASVKMAEEPAHRVYGPMMLVTTGTVFTVTMCIADDVPQLVVTV